MVKFKLKSRDFDYNRFVCAEFFVGSEWMLGGYGIMLIPYRERSNITLSLGRFVERVAILTKQ